MLLFCFLSNQENLYIIHLVQNLFYVNYDIIHKHNQKIKSLPLIDVSNPIWYLERSNWKFFSITSFALSLIMILMLLPFKCITLSSSLSLKEIKLIAIVNWIFHVLDFLGTFTFFKYGLILSRYYSTGSILFLSPLLLYSI